MTPEKNIMEKAGRITGYTVPDGFFEKKFAEIHAALPPLPEPLKAQKLSRWHRMRPYVYLAAMFAGIWCMMKMFYIATDRTDVSLENPPAQVAAVIESSPEVIDLYSQSNTSDDYALVNSVLSQYDSFETFEDDFEQEYEVTESEETL